MPYYNLLKDWEPEARKRAIQGIEALRAQKRREIPARTLNDTILLATWNLRDFGNEDKRAKGDLDRPGPRLPESYFYIAEVISAFDIVALQEVNSLAALEKLMDVLGPSWEYLATDIKPDAGGNDERMVFVYDKRKIWFKHLAGQIVLSGNEQFVRTPFYAAFQAGWFRFSLCTVHILYGDFQDTSEREREIDQIAGFLSERSARNHENLILLGDFNILNRNDSTFAPLKKHDWNVPVEHASNITKSKFYDQIAFKLSEGVLRQGRSNPNAGAFDFFQSVFLPDMADEYYKAAEATGRPMGSWTNTPNWPQENQILTPAQYYERQWRTWQMSDHFPLWIELAIEFSDEYLEKLKTSS